RYIVLITPFTVNFVLMALSGICNMNLTPSLIINPAQFSYVSGFVIMFEAIALFLVSFILFLNRGLNNETC
ncbi:hypothetical protein, partial [Cellulosilyticum ruminicola]|uniref:hypothetical protein n=1 Tax=Cellulosilyticum ruminicola TaxID=425254 RepID=UPI001A9A6A58